MTPRPTSVVAQPATFLLRLRHGERAGLSRFVKPTLTGLKTLRAAKAGAAVAASAPVAGTFFGYTATGGILGYLGLGAAAATPVGWVVASAIAAGAASAGAGWIFDRQRPTASIPLSLETGLDTLALRLFEAQGALAIRIAAIDGVIVPEETMAIMRYFIEDWGYPPAFVAKVHQRLLDETGRTTIATMAHDIANYQANNPDCNADAMLADLIAFLHTLVLADGRLDERETLAIDAVVRVFAEELALVRFAGRTLANWRSRAGQSLAKLRKRPTDPAAPASEAARR